VKELVELLVKALVDYPDAVDIQERETDSSVIVEVRVADEDVGKVIGKGGRVVKAIRTVVKAAASRGTKKVMVEILS